MPVYLGFDCGTQSFSVVAIAVAGARREVVFQRSLGFDEHFPAYHTRNGVLPSADPRVARSSPLLWAEALDRMMAVVARESGIALEDIRAIAGSAQQHGSVYLNETAATTLARLAPQRPLAEQIGAMFSRGDAPIWMDTSTAGECDAITRSLGGPEALARLTGSRAFTRFTGPQIRKFAAAEPASYARTAQIHLVSSYLASLLAGRHAPLDLGDGSGTNLMDLSAGCWSPVALAATAPGLAARLPELRASWTAVGGLAPYWMKRYGFPPALVVLWSGDNPCSLIGTGLAREGRIAVSLGTSDTLFGPRRAPDPDPSGAGHVFRAPSGGYMGLVCCRNGSLARERVRADYGLDWAGFSRALRETPPGNRGRILLPWFEPEITPPVTEPGARRYGLAADDGPANVRAVVEGQMLALALHSAWMGTRPAAIHATGGAAANRDLLQVMADVFGADVYRLEVGNSACLGAALRAYHAERLAAGHEVSWEEVMAGFAEPDPASRVAPVPANVEIYRRLAPRYAACEQHALRGASAGEPAARPCS